VSKLIFETNKELSGLIFGSDKNKAVHKVKRLISMGSNSYGHENIYVACHDSQVLGIAVAYSLEDKVDWQELRTFLRVMSIHEKVKFIFLIIPFLEIIMPEDLMPGDLYICNIVVGGENRKQGVGSFLLSRLKEQARHDGFKRLWLYVSHDNEIAIKLYEKMGFRICRKRKLPLPWLKIETYKMELVL
jgi:ribosomal protein S18 acetylase RimI-like enzyme